MTNLWVGWSGVRILEGERFFSFPKRSHRLWCPHSLLFSGRQRSWTGVKRPGIDADHWRPPSAEVKNEPHPYSPSMPWMRGHRQLYVLLPLPLPTRVLRCRAIVSHILEYRHNWSHHSVNWWKSQVMPLLTDDFDTQWCETFFVPMNV